MISDNYAEVAYNMPEHGTFSLIQGDYIILQNQSTGEFERQFNEQDIPYSKCELGRNIQFDEAKEIL